MSDRICEHCGVSNDGNRVYCKDCGNRLPEQMGNREGASTEPEFLTAGLAAPPIPTTNYRPPVRRDFPARIPVKNRSFFGGLFKLAFLGFLLACLVEVVRPPDGIPPDIAANSRSAAKTLAHLQMCAQSRTVRTWTIPLPVLNEYIASVARQAPDARAFVTLDMGEIHFFDERNIFGHAIYFSLLTVPEESGGTLRARLKGTSIGRLPLPSFFTGLIQTLFQPILNRLSPAFDLVQKAQTIVITPTDITLQWLGSGNKASP